MKYKVRLRDKVYEVEVERGEAILLDEYEAAAPTATAAQEAAQTAAPVPAAEAGSICSPLPGTVLEIKVTVGEKVKKGQALLLLEAMKMENEITAPQDGTVKAIHTSKGYSVKTGTPLISLG